MLDTITNFGKNRSGNYTLLKSYSDASHFSLEQINREDIAKLTISSSRIRGAISAGKMQEALTLLAEPFSIRGQVGHGEKVGTQIGFPTANIKIQHKHKIIPAIGVYACMVEVNKQQFKGMAYIGKRPTLNLGDELRIEVNIFDFSENIYGSDLTLLFYKKIRGDQRFDSLEELKQQLAKDKAATLQFFSRPSMSVVVLNYNGEKYLQQFLPTLINNTTEGVRIIIADNNSSDNSKEIVTSISKNIDWISLDKNYGFAEGYNQALKQISTDYAIILNSDVEVSPGWDLALYEQLNKSEEIIACQPQILSFNEKDSYEHAGAAGGFIDRLGYVFCRGRILNTIEKINPAYEINTEIFWASGAAIAVRLEKFKALGGFDKDYFAHYEEIDFCWRAKRAGYKICYVSNSTVYHVGGGTLSYNNPRKIFLNFRNSLITLFKNNSGAEAWLKVFQRMCLDAPTALLFLSQLNVKAVIQIIRAHWSFITRIGYYLKRKRAFNKLIEKNSIGNNRAHIGQYKFLLPFQFYLRGKKYFKDL